MAVAGLLPEIIGEEGFDPPVPVVCVFEDVPHSGREREKIA